MPVIRLLIMFWLLLSWPVVAASVPRPGPPDPAATVPRININTANAEALDEALVGIGPSKARAIVAWRQQNGPFRSLAQLEEVKGLGPAFVARNKGRMVLR